MSLYHIKHGKFGRGVFNNFSLPAGHTVMRCRIVEDRHVPDYSFVGPEGKDCLVLGDGSLFNHSSDPNVEYRLQKINDEFFMEFYTIKDIVGCKELFINYKQDSPDINLEQVYGIKE